MQSTPLSSIDRKILLLLQHNADLSAAEIAEKVELSQSPCWRRIHRMQEEGLIEPMVTLGDRVERGDVVARIYPFGRSGRAPVPCHARRDGIVMARHVPGLVKPGDCIAVLAVPVI